MNAINRTRAYAMCIICRSAAGRLSINKERLKISNYIFLRVCIKVSLFKLIQYCDIIREHKW